MNDPHESGRPAARLVAVVLFAIASRVLPSCKNLVKVDVPECTSDSDCENACSDVRNAHGSPHCVFDKCQIQSGQDHVRCSTDDDD
jgi:hypothetical protein